MKLFAALVIILMAHPAGASDRPLACLPSEQFQIGGIGPRSDISKVEALGPALATETYGGEDDGGYYEGLLQKYESLEINFEQLRGVERVATTTSGTDLPGSIRIGMPLTQVGELLHFGTAWLATPHHASCMRRRLWRRDPSTLLGPSF